MVFSISDPTETAIQKMIQAHRHMIRPGNNPATNRELELQITTLEKAPRDAVRLERLIRKKTLEKERANFFMETQRLLTELEMLEVVLYLVSRESE